MIDFYDEKTVLKVLLKDKVVREILQGNKIQTLKELLEFKRTINEETGVAGVELSEGCLSSFAFHHIKDGKVAIRIGLKASGTPYWNADFEQIGLYLPIPEKLKAELLRADQNKLLMKYLEKEK